MCVGYRIINTTVYRDGGVNRQESTSSAVRTTAANLQSPIKRLRVEGSNISTCADRACGHIQSIEALIAHTRQEVSIRTARCTYLSCKTYNSCASTNTNGLLIRKRISASKQRSIKCNIRVIGTNLHWSHDTADSRSRRQRYCTRIALSACGD